MKLNRKGFTLIELLAVIVIIGLVLGLSTYGIIKAVNNSKEKARDITKNSIIKASETYSKEKTWIEKSDPYEEYFCVTIEKLINKGLLKEEVLNEDYKIEKNHFVLLTRNKKTKVIKEKKLITDSENKDSEKCKGIITFGIDYITNGGSLANTVTNEYIFGEEKKLPEEDEITKSYHTFEGWYTNEDFIGSAVKVISKTDSGKKTFYAKWEAYTYEITYNANGGSGEPNPQIKKHGDNLTLSSTKPTRSGYIFNGWNTNANGTGTSYNSGASYTNDKDVTLYAQWKQLNTYTIKFDRNGGTGSVPSDIVKTGENTSIVMGDIGQDEPTKSGFDFYGWSASTTYTSSTKMISYYSNRQPALTTSNTWTYENYCSNTGGSKSSNTLTLYAIWKKATSIVPSTPSCSASLYCPYSSYSWGVEITSGITLEYDRSCTDSIYLTSSDCALKSSQGAKSNCLNGSRIRYDWTYNGSNVYINSYYYTNNSNVNSANASTNNASHTIELYVNGVRTDSCTYTIRK